MDSGRIEACPKPI